MLRYNTSGKSSSPRRARYSSSCGSKACSSGGGVGMRTFAMSAGSTSSSRSPSTGRALRRAAKLRLRVENGQEYTTPLTTLADNKFSTARRGAGWAVLLRRGVSAEVDSFVERHVCEAGNAKRRSRARSSGEFSAEVDGLESEAASDDRLLPAG